MDDNSQMSNWAKWGMGLIGLGAVAAALTIPHIGIWVALIILVLAVLLFGGYYLWRQQRAKHQREQFSSAIQTQTAEAPKSISDPNKRAALDKVRQKFQNGLHEFKSRGKDIYKLPWYVIIGESGSGKTEAIRHSGIDFPPGLQDELQGSGGTVNMDWWFTNRGIILDTAGSMIFNEARAGESPEWREFLNLLRKSRPHCPINGLLLVLSIESLIKDSADKIAQKASVLAQQLDLIQRTLDVRFPVYLLVTKSDLLTGFREFFDNIDDPLLQSQIFGWSNPDPLDALFRPDLVEQHLKNVADRLRRRRFALLRDALAANRTGETQFFGGKATVPGNRPPTTRHLDDVDRMFTLPESIMRLAPRLRRYLETIFVAGEWSAKPVFLRGIYFTSSMREGKALDEAISFATGLPLDQLPEDRRWEKNRAYFLRDLLHEKVFRESGLVTRATNTLKLLRKRQFLIMGTAGAALLLLILFSFFGYRNLKRSVLGESVYWEAGAANWNQGIWSPTIVTGSGDLTHFIYGGTNSVPALEGKVNLSVVQYHQHLAQIAQRPLAINWIFKPLAWVNAGAVKDRAIAQRRLFEAGVVAPLVQDAKTKMIGTQPPPGAPLARQREALLSLMNMEADSRMEGNLPLIDTNSATKYLKSFLSYLTESDVTPDPGLVGTFVSTYSYEMRARNGGVWPPAYLLGGPTLYSNLAIKVGMDNFQMASMAAQSNIQQHLQLVDDFADNLHDYHQRELKWLPQPPSSCADELKQSKYNLDLSWARLTASTNFSADLLTNLSLRYGLMAFSASNSSASALAGPVKNILIRLPLSDQKRTLFYQIAQRLNELGSQASDSILSEYYKRQGFIPLLDSNCLPVVTFNNQDLAAYQARWLIYSNACALASTPLTMNDSLIGDQWKRYGEIKARADQFQTDLLNYHGPLATRVTAACRQIAAEAQQNLEGQFVDSYVQAVAHKLVDLSSQPQSSVAVFTNSRVWMARVNADLQSKDRLGGQAARLDPVSPDVKQARQDILTSLGSELHRRAGFPILIQSPNNMDVDGLETLREFISGVQKELADPVWQADSSAAMAGLQNQCNVYWQVGNSLLAAGGASAQWELWFVPPDQDDNADKDIVAIFRDMRALSGDAQGEWKDVAVVNSPIQLLDKANIGSNVSLRINCLRDSASPEDMRLDKADWGLVRLIADARLNAERLDNGYWRFSVPLKAVRNGVNHSGKAVFEARLAGHLPKLEDWPKQ